MKRSRNGFWTQITWCVIALGICQTPHALANQLSQADVENDPELPPREVDFEEAAPQTRKFECNCSGVPAGGAVIAEDPQNELSLVVRDGDPANCRFDLLLQMGTQEVSLANVPGGYLIASVGYDPTDSRRALVAVTNIISEPSTPTGWRRIERTTVQFWSV